MTTDNLPTPEQWAPVVEALEEATRDYWVQQMDQSWDYMLDETTHHLANIVRMYFPEFNEKCKQQAKERTDEMNEDRHKQEEELYGQSQV